MFLAAISNLLDWDYWVSNPWLALVSIFQLWMLISTERFANCSQNNGRQTKYSYTTTSTNQNKRRLTGKICPSVQYTWERDAQ